MSTPSCFHSATDANVATGPCDTTTTTTVCGCGLPSGADRPQYVMKVRTVYGGLANVIESQRDLYEPLT